ncbi:hypothetical protein Hanom_Chr17g01553441 [Helianthus anomalus]
MLAPYARIGKQSMASGGLFSSLKNSVAALPSSVSEFERPECRFSTQQRLATYFYKVYIRMTLIVRMNTLKLVLVITRVLVGMGSRSSVWFDWIWLRSYWPRDCEYGECIRDTSTGDVKVPPLMQSVVLWGVFLAGSANTRYQIVNGMESLVEASPLVKHVAVVAMAFTVGSVSQMTSMAGCNL